MARFHPGMALIGALSFGLASAITVSLSSDWGGLGPLVMVAIPTIVGGLTAMFVARSAVDAKPDKLWLVALIAGILPYLLGSLGALGGFAAFASVEPPPEGCWMACDPMLGVIADGMVFGMALAGVLVCSIVGALITKMMTIGARPSEQAEA